MESQGEPQHRSEDEVVDLGSLELHAPTFKEGPAHRVEQTRALFAYLLLGLFAATLGSLILLLGLGRLTVQDFSEVAGVVISPVVGLLGAAAGYYYGRGDR